MFNTHIKIGYATWCIISISTLIYGRSIHRHVDPQTPYITVQWEDSDEHYTLSKPHLQYRPLFETFDKEYLMNHMLPDGPMPYRSDNTQSVLGTELAEIIESVIASIQTKKKKSVNAEFIRQSFSMLKQCDFRDNTKSGLIILKFKNYPFVLKLFIEHPRSFANPESKGFQVRGIFAMGGSLRHTLGFTRLKNMENIEAKIAGHPYWSERITTPRKWFWMPKNVRMMKITGYNIGATPGPHTITIPSVYALICEAIEKDPQKPNPQECLDLGSYLEFTVDPHYPNFFLEKGRNRIALIDTEHFPTLIGARQKIKRTRNYCAWYARIAHNYLKKRLFAEKSYRKRRQLTIDSEYAL